MANTASTFTKLLALKDGSGNPGAPASTDKFDLTASQFLLTGPLDVVGAGSVSGIFGVGGAATLNSTLGVTGVSSLHNTSIDGTLGVTGLGSFESLGVQNKSTLHELQATDGTFSGIISSGGKASLDSLEVTQASTLKGALAVTGKTSLTSDLAVGGNATFAGNVSVAGTLITTSTESVLIADNFLDMNSDLTTVTPQTTGFTFNYSPIAAGVISSFELSGQNSIINTADALAVGAGDFIMVANPGAGLEANAGIFQVLSRAGTAITINTAATLGFVKKSITAAATVSGATIAHINLGVLQVATNGDLQWNEGASAGLMVGGDVPFDGYVGAQTWTASIANTGSLTNHGPVTFDTFGQGQFAVAGAFAVTGASTFAGAISQSGGDFSINNSGGTSNALSLSEVAGTVDAKASAGSLYSMDVNGTTELFYIGDGTPDAVQVTKQGALNTAETDIPLQVAYLKGNVIETSANARPVTINLGSGFTGNALAVTGPTKITGVLTVTANSAIGGNSSVGGELIVTGAASLSSTLGVGNKTSITSSAGTAASSGNADLNVTNYLWVGGASAFGGKATIESLEVTNASALKSTLDVVGDTTVTKLTASGDASLVKLTASGATSLASLTASGFTSLDSATKLSTADADLKVAGYSSFAKDVKINAALAAGATTITGTLSSSGAATLNSLAVTTTSTLTGAVTAQGALTVSGATDVQALSAKATDITGKLTATDDVAFSAALAVSGASTLASLGVTAAATVGGTLGVTGASTLAGLTAGASSLASLGVSGNSVLTGTLGVTGATSVTTITSSGAADLNSLTVQLTSHLIGKVTADGALTVSGATGVQALSAKNTLIDGTLGVSGLSTLDSASVTNDLAVGGASTITSLSATSGSFSSTLGVTGVTSLTCATKSNTADADLKVSGYSSFAKGALFSSKVEVTGALTASDIAVSGLLDLNGSVDADVSSFDVASAGAFNLAASAGNIVVTASGNLKLNATSIASSIAVAADAANIAQYSVVTMGASGLVAAQANVKDMMGIGVACEAILASSDSAGKIVEFGQSLVNVEAGLLVAVAAGDNLYVSAATAGCVTNVMPSAANATVFYFGKALGAPSAGKVKVAVRQQFLYNTYA